MQGVDAIVHAASPCNFSTEDPDNIIGPAVAGTVAVLRAVQRSGPSVRHVVITGSIAALIENTAKPGRVFDEKGWNDLAVREVETKGRVAGSFDKYLASKTLQERAVWAFMDTTKGQLGFDLVVLNPSYTFGPILHDVGAAEKLNLTMARSWQAVTQPNDNNFLTTEG